MRQQNVFRFLQVRPPQRASDEELRALSTPADPDATEEVSAAAIEERGRSGSGEGALVAVADRFREMPGYFRRDSLVARLLALRDPVLALVREAPPPAEFRARVRTLWESGEGPEPKPFSALAERARGAWRDYLALAIVPDRYKADRQDLLFVLRLLFLLSAWDDDAALARALANFERIRPALPASFTAALAVGEAAEGQPPAAPPPQAAAYERHEQLLRTKDEILGLRLQRLARVDAVTAELNRVVQAHVEGRLRAGGNATRKKTAGASPLELAKLIDLRSLKLPATLGQAPNPDAPLATDELRRANGVRRFAQSEGLDEANLTIPVLLERVQSALARSYGELAREARKEHR